MMRFGKAIVEVTEAVAEDQNVVPSSSIQIESFGAEHIALRKKEARSNPTPPPSFHIRGRWHTGCPHSNNLNHLCSPMHEPIFAGSMTCGLVALLSVLILYI
jgi:hypothetical protein